jgi:hypothetical protein
LMMSANKMAGVTARNAARKGEEAASLGMLRRLPTPTVFMGW